MARGDSGRIVIEVDPVLKCRLYAALAISGRTLKDWFLSNALRYCDDAMQPGLFEQDKATRKDDLSRPGSKAT